MTHISDSSHLSSLWLNTQSWHLTENQILSFKSQGVDCFCAVIRSDAVFLLSGSKNAQTVEGRACRLLSFLLSWHLRLRSVELVVRRQSQQRSLTFRSGHQADTCERLCSRRSLWVVTQPDRSEVIFILLSYLSVCGVTFPSKQIQLTQRMELLSWHISDAAAEAPE